MREKIIRIIRQIKLRTWVAIGVVIILAPIAIFRIFYQTEAALLPPTAYWALDEGVDNTCANGTDDACDGTGNGNDLARTGAVWRDENSCFSGKCLFFDGSGDYITRADDNDLDFAAADSFSIGGWFRRPAIATNPDYLVAKYGTAGYKIYMNADGTVTCGIDDDSSWTPDASATSPERYDDNLWHHFQCIKNGTSSLTLYLDGYQVDQNVSISGIGSLENAAAFYIGVDSDGSSNSWEGFVDEVKVYNYVRSEKETKADGLRDADEKGTSAAIGGGAEYLTDGLIGYWEFDHTSGNATDSSGNGRTLTNQGTTPYNVGRFGYGPTFNGSTRYFSAGSTISGIYSISFWAKPDTTTDNYYINLTSGVYISSSSGSLNVVGFAEPTVYVNGVVSSSVVANSWQLVTVTTNTAISASAFEVGRANGSYATNNSQIDSVRLYNRAITATEASRLYDWGPGPAAYWKMDENTGQTAFDTSGNGLNATRGSSTSTESIDPTWEVGKVGSSLGFDGGTSDKYARAANNALLNVDANTSITIAAWVRRVGSASFNTPMMIADKRNSGSNAGYYFALAATGDTCDEASTNGYSPCLRLTDASGNNYTIRTTISYILADSTWHHVAVVFDRNNEANNVIYINGIPQAVTRSGTLSSFGNATESGLFCIGINQTGVSCGNTNEFNGNIDDFKFYRYARTPAQIMEDYNANHPSTSMGAGSRVGYWKFDEMTGIKASDTGELGNHLWLVNSPAWTAGKINGGLDFEAGNYQAASLTRMYEGVTERGFMNITGSLSLSAWIKPESVTASTSFVIAQKADGAYRLEQYGDEIRMYIGSSSNYQTTNAANLQTGAWYHVAGVYDAPTQRVRIFINGREEGSTVTGAIPSSITHDDGNFAVGGNSRASITESFFIGNTTAHNVLMPATVADGDLLITVFANDGNATVTTPSGWTQLWSTANGTDLRISGYAKRAAGTEGGTTVDFVTSATEAAGAYVYKIAAGVWNDTGTIADGVKSATAATGSSTTPDPPSFTSGWGSVSTLWFATYVSNGSTYINNIPTDYGNDTFITDTIQSAANTVGIGSARRLLTAATEDPATFTLSASSVWVAQTFAVRLSGNLIENPYDGVIDEVQLYNLPLSEEQVRVLTNMNASVNFGTGVNEAEDLVDGAGSPPIAYWKMDENTGSGTGSVRDTSGNSRHASMNGSLGASSWRPGKMGSGLIFNGTSDYLSIDDFYVANITVTAWVWLDPGHSNSYTYTGAVSKWTTDGNPDEWYMGISSGNFSYWVDAASARTGLDTSIPITKGKWTHMAMTYDGTTLIGYADGVAITSAVNSGGNLDNTSQPIAIGYNAPGSTGRYWNGYIDEVKIYDYARTQAQIAYDYNRGGPMAHWQMDENTGTAVNDSSGNSYTGTLNGTPDWTSGKYNYAINFDGSTNYVQVSDNTYLRFDASTQDFSLFAWVKRDTNGEMNIISKEDADNDGWRLQFTSGNAVRCSVDAIDIDSTLAITDSNWHHVGCTIDRDGNGRVYIDGAANGNATAISSEAMANTANIRIGTRSYSSTNYFDGLIDDVRIYNYALSAAQVRKVYNSSAIRFGPNEGAP